MPKKELLMTFKRNYSWSLQNILKLDLPKWLVAQDWIRALGRNAESSSFDGVSSKLLQQGQKDKDDS